MYDLKKITPVLRHLQKISPNMYRDIGGEIMIHCYSCDDASRRNASNHGHLYLATNAPVFNCFRCGTSGTIIRLLIETGFNDEEVIKYISSFIRYNFIKNYSRQLTTNSTTVDQILEQNIYRIIKFKKEKKDEFNLFKNYINERIGNVDYNTFLIYPTFINDGIKDLTSCAFNNASDEFVTARVIGESKIRYKNSDQSSLYYFQPQNYERFNRVVIGEGPFDIITLYLYSNVFKDCLFISISGKKYISSLELLITKFMLIGEYEINLIFDSEFKFKEPTIIRSRFLSEKYNQNIIVRGFAPLEPFGDTGDFPQVMEIDV
jgi:hypothetical protein